MKKRLVIPAILLAVPLLMAAQPQNLTITPGGTPFIFRIQEMGLAKPTPMTPTHQDSIKADWIHFTMFEDGLFSSNQMVTRAFGSTGQKKFEKDRKGKYTGQENPPHAAKTVEVNTGGITPPPPPPSPSVSDPFSLRLTQADSIHPEWGAAALSDTHYFALVLKNLDFEKSKTGSFSLRFPTDAFDYMGTVFPPNPSVFGTPSIYTDGGDATHGPGTIYSWPVSVLQKRDSQTIFVKLRVKDAVRDSLQLIELNTNLNATDAQTIPGGTTIFLAPATKGNETRVSNPYNFRGTNSTVVAINAARDPNSISVQPGRLPPAGSAPAHKLRYKVTVENLGTALAKFLIVNINFDKKIATGAPLQATALNFPNANTTSTDENIKFSSTTVGWSGSTLRLQFNNANIAPAGSGYYSKAGFEIEVETRSGIELKEGEKIVTDALIRMKSSATSADDSVHTDPAFVWIEHPGKIPFGCVLGIKGHTSLFAADSAIITRGLDLTLRFPLANRLLNDLADKSVLPPHLFWQIEAGWGTSSFNAPADAGIFTTKYIHLTPVLIRYYHPFYPSSHLLYAGVSGGYSAGYVYEGKLNGQKASLPSGFGKRLEHELALSIDFSNRIDVPAWTLGLGYKFRWNNLLGQQTSYGCPFVYLQLDIVRFNRRFIKIWDKTKFY